MDSSPLALLPKDIFRVIVRLLNAQSILNLRASCRLANREFLEIFENIKKFTAKYYCAHCGEREIKLEKYCCICWQTVCIICNKHPGHHTIWQIWHDELQFHINICQMHLYYVCRQCGEIPLMVNGLVMHKGAIKCRKCVYGSSDVVYMEGGKILNPDRTFYPPFGPIMMD